MQISQMLLGSQVKKLRQAMLNLKAMFSYDGSAKTAQGLTSLEKSLRQIEKLNECLQSQDNSDITLQVLYLNFRDLKIKYRTAFRQSRRLQVMQGRSVKADNRKVIPLSTVAA